ncbi:hypothetical protein H9Y04_32225 [Streptomyces sp. TRM66268-LWL]|uniref:Uncharacterized protein n=1 Tax=Streptomyces polyasparticus TaxID=2767826 RepID=A0ABR7SRA1_9ACTN|nr:hypothetical protein [Streptomyces polyasparticus]
MRLLRSRLTVPDVDGRTMAERVLAQLVAEHVPTPVPEPPSRLERLRGWFRMRRARIAAALCGVLVVAVLTPPVRAAVADWFDFGGIEVRRPSPSAPPPSPEPVPGCGRGVSLSEAEKRAGFKALRPEAMPGAPVASVSADRRVISLCWRDAQGLVIRLDQFKDPVDPAFGKVAGMEYTEVPGAGAAWWFREPHLLEIRLLDETGEPYTHAVRTAGPTLVWQKGGAGDGTAITLRLEGIDQLQKAVDAAASVR